MEKDLVVLTYILTYTFVALTWMVFEAGSELKLVTDEVVTVTTFFIFVDTDAGVGEMTFAPSV